MSRGIKGPTAQMGGNEQEEADRDNRIFDEHSEALKYKDVDDKIDAPIQSI